MAVIKKPTTDATIQVIEVHQDEVRFQLISRSPLIMERVGPKAWRELLFPKGRMSTAEKASNLKHEPLHEFRHAAYLTDTGPTLLYMPSTAIKDAVRSAAIDLAGVTKAEIGRLTYIEGDQIPIWGVPQLLMSVVRSSDMAKTPDIRTRPIVPLWCTDIVIQFVRPKLTAQAIGNLLAAAGMTIGIGGWRQEKGSGSYGLWRMVTPEDAGLFAAIQEQGREVQAAAMADPIAYDEQSREMLEWFDEEYDRRKQRGVASVFALPNGSDNETD
jgi:hypothetical protein